MAGAGAAVAQEPVTAPAAPESDAGAAGGASTPASGATSAQGDAAEAGIQPKVGEPPRAAPATAEGPAGVPWGRFREVQTAHTRLKGEYGNATQEWQAREQELNGQLTQERQKSQDYELLRSLLHQHPDLADQLYERVGGQPGRGAAPRPGASLAAAQPGVAKLAPEHEKLLKETATFLQQQGAEQREARRREELTRTDAELSTRVTDMLRERNYNEKWLGPAKAYILSRAAQMGDAQMDDVPYLFAEWFKDVHSLVQGQIDGIVKGKVQDQSIPGTPVGGAPVRAAVKGNPNDGNTAGQFEEALRRMGWT